MVTNTPVTISIPSSITVYVNGSSLPLALNVPNSPYSDVEILVDLNETKYNGAFGMDEDYSSPNIEFKYGIEKRYLSFFATSAITSFPTTFSVSLALDGTNYESYTLSSSTIQVNIATTTFVAPTVSGS